MEDCDDFDFLDDHEDVCDGCGSDGIGGTYCPMCCSNGGWYSPGTEDCEFCDYSDECAEFCINSGRF